MGICAIPLRSLGKLSGRVGLGAGAAADGGRGVHASRVRTCIGGLGGRRSDCGVVRIGTAGSICAVVSGEPELREQCERVEHDREYHGGEQLL